MSDPRSAAPSLSQRLINSGWEQGTVFDAPNLSFVHNALASSSSDLVELKPRKMKARERLVVISQTCDISASEQVEPFIEALICKREPNAERLAKWDRNSARYFVVDPASGLVAIAHYRLSIHKAVVETLNPQPWLGSPERLDRFIGWLARRYDRPAIPDNIVAALQPAIDRALARLDESDPNLGIAFSQAVYQLRIGLPEHEILPFELRLLVMLETKTLTTQQADAIEAFKGAIHREIDPQQITITSANLYTDDQLSLAEFYATRPLYLEWLSYEGDVSVGAMPPGRS